MRPYVHASTSDRHTAHARTFSNSADLGSFRNQLVLELFISGPGNVMGAYAWSSNRHK